MRKKFRYWLINYKAFSEKKTDAIMSDIESLSSEAMQAGMIGQSFFTVANFITFAKARQSLHNKKQLTSPEKRALELYGDFLQFVELTNFVFPEDHSRLHEYCAGIKMAYSYKAVLLLSLLKRQKNGKCGIDELTDECISYYETRLRSGLLAEKENSIFSRPIDNRKEATKVLAANPIAVLEKDGVISFDKKSGIVSFRDEYFPDESVLSQVRTDLTDALDKYYASIPNPLFVGESAINAMIKGIVKEIDQDPNSDRRHKSLDLLAELESLWAETKIDRKPKLGNTGNLVALSEEDTRSVGKLVKDTMQALEESGVSFSEEEIDKFTDKAWSKEQLHTYYAFMKRYDPAIELSEQKKDYLGNNRYWNQIFKFGGVEVLITSEWYKGDKPFFIRWYNAFLHDRGVK